MKRVTILAVFVLALASASASEDNSVEDRVNGENGWYVPQLDGTFEWWSLEEAEEKLSQIEAMESRGLSTNPVTFYLFTSSNPSKSSKISASGNSVANSNFDPSHPTKIAIHGWTQSHISSMNKNIRNAWLSKGDYNVIIVDWSRARGEYATAVAAVPTVGKKVAALIDFLHDSHGLSLDDLEVAGHSLGAHVAGYAGKNVGSGQIHTIVGLDPALPLFSYTKPKKRLAKTDAWYVESIQTDGGQLGFLQPIGAGAFYPNGGKSQPGCTLDVTGACSHGRSVTYYVEAIEKDDFPSIKCQDYVEAVNDDCGSTYSSVRMGADTNAYMVDGYFYVPVNSKSPYGKGS